MNNKDEIPKMPLWIGATRIKEKSLTWINERGKNSTLSSVSKKYIIYKYVEPTYMELYWYQNCIMLQATFQITLQ